MRRIVFVSAIIVIAILLLCLSIYFLGIGFYVISSDSMKRENNETFYNFWKELGYDKPVVDKFPLINGFENGDILVVTKSPEYKIGDVIVAGKGKSLVAHRLFKMNETNIWLIGDRETNYEVLEVTPELRENIVGKGINTIPKIGLLNLWINNLEYK